MLSWLNETFSLPAVLACFGALVSASGAIWASYEQNKSQRLAEAQTVEIRRLNTKILSLSEESKVLAKEGIASVTGGDGFAYVDILKGHFSNAFSPVIATESAYPQYDISIRFYDEDQNHLAQIANPLMLGVATLPPGHSVVERIPAFDVSGKQDYARFNLFISARNGSFIEELRLRKVDGEWYSAFRVFKSGLAGKSALLIERAMSKYPRSIDGSLEW
ncbi:hypothetical protein [Pseudomonas kurunegalensis]|uniref:hypothetical protein n=1 Tax=Pseudomonas kurunegalensis TaxID=485880 RepID=UPI00236422CE|nr:hypothetical protein [Pseudomonas kurunegalensis]MDD2133614.1 hypothetical protein [Pseudomonas kurunegalensis]